MEVPATQRFGRPAIARCRALAQDRSASWRHWFAGFCGDMDSLQLQLLQLIAGFDIIVSVVFLII